MRRPPSRADRRAASPRRAAAAPAPTKAGSVTTRARDKYSAGPGTKPLPSGSGRGFPVASTSAVEAPRSSVSSAGSSFRPHGEPVLALGAAGGLLQENEQQRELEVGDGTVVDRLALVGRGERPALDRVSQHDDPPARASLLGHHRAERPRELPRPADWRGHVAAVRHQRAPRGLLLGRLRLDRCAVDPAVRGVVHIAVAGGPFALAEETGGLRDPDRLAAADRVPLRRGLPQCGDRKPLRRVAEVDERAGDQVARVIDVVSVCPGTSKLAGPSARCSLRRAPGSPAAARRRPAQSAPGPAPAPRGRNRLGTPGRTATSPTRRSAFQEPGTHRQPVAHLRS